MLSSKEKKEMLEDAADPKRREEFRLLRRNRKALKTLDEYIAFLMDVQKVNPFEHRPHVTPAGKYIL